MEHVETYRQHHFWAWTEKDGVAWNGCYALDNGTLERGLGRSCKAEEQVLRAAIETARKRLEATHSAGSGGEGP